MRMYPVNTKMSTSAADHELLLEDVVQTLNVNKVFLQVQPKGIFEQNATYHNNVKRQVQMPALILGQDEMTGAETPSSGGPGDSGSMSMAQSLFTAIASALGVHVNTKWMQLLKQINDPVSVLNQIADSENCVFYLVHPRASGGIVVSYGSTSGAQYGIAISKQDAKYIVNMKRADKSSIASALEKQGCWPIADLKTLKKEKIKQTQDRATGHGISCVNEDGGRKLKDALVTELDAYYKNLNVSLLE